MNRYGRELRSRRDSNTIRYHHNPVCYPRCYIHLRWRFSFKQWIKFWNKKGGTYGAYVWYFHPPSLYLYANGPWSSVKHTLHFIPTRNLNWLFFDTDLLWPRILPEFLGLLSKLSSRFDLCQSLCPPSLLHSLWSLYVTDNPTSGPHVTFGESFEIYCWISLAEHHKGFIGIWASKIHPTKCSKKCSRVHGSHLPQVSYPTSSHLDWVSQLPKEKTSDQEWNIEISMAAPICVAKFSVLLKPSISLLKVQLVWKCEYFCWLPKYAKDTNPILSKLAHLPQILGLPCSKWQNATRSLFVSCLFVRAKGNHKNSLFCHGTWLGLDEEATNKRL